MSEQALTTSDESPSRRSRGCKSGGGACGPLSLVLACVLLFAPSITLAQPSAEDVFRGFNQQLDAPSTNSSTFFIFVCTLIGVVVLVVWFSQRRRQKQATPDSLNHPGKLMKEVARAVNLRPVEVRQVKLLAETNVDVRYPLTLLLCPSLLAKSIKTQPAKMDRAVVQQLARKLMKRDA